MTLDYVNGFVNRSNRNLLMWCLVGVAVLVIAAAIGSNYLYNFFAGPFTISGDQIVNVSGLNDLQQKFITVTGDDKLIDTGYQFVSTSSGGKDTVEAYYEALILGDKLLLVKTDSLLDTDTVTGGLVDMPGDVRSQVISDIESEYPDLKDTFLPFMLDTGNYRIPGYIGLFVAAIVLILTLIGWSRWLTRRGDPLKHPILKKLSRFGDAQSIAQQIEMELVGDPVKVGNLRFTRTWMIQEIASTFNATRFNDVMWAYKRVTQHRTNGINTRKTYSALIYDRYGAIITINGKEKLVEDTLTEVMRRAPGTVAGYSADILKMWNTNRAGFAAAVDQKRQQAAAPR
jgi:Family of unknown function (DUF6709)